MNEEEHQQKAEKFTDTITKYSEEMEEFIKYLDTLKFSNMTDLLAFVVPYLNAANNEQENTLMQLKSAAIVQKYFIYFVDYACHMELMMAKTKAVIEKAVKEQGGGEGNTGGNSNKTLH
jgi:hypothetical protein